MTTHASVPLFVLFCFCSVLYSFSVSTPFIPPPHCSPHSSPQTNERDVRIAKLETEMTKRGSSAAIKDTEITQELKSVKLELSLNQAKHHTAERELSRLATELHGERSLRLALTDELQRLKQAVGQPQHRVPSSPRLAQHLGIYSHGVAPGAVAPAPGDAPPGMAVVGLAPLKKNKAGSGSGSGSGGLLRHSAESASTTTVDNNNVYASPVFATATANGNANGNGNGNTKAHVNHHASWK